MLLMPGIYKVVGNRGCNCYIIETGAGLVVIDSGLLGSDTAIRRYIEMQLDATTEDIIYIIVTHAHRDVAESVPDLLSYSPNAQLVIHKADIEAFKRIAFMPEDIELVIIEDRHTLEDADIEIHHAPGHTAGSIVAKYDRALFCGDVVYLADYYWLCISCISFQFRLISFRS